MVTLRAAAATLYVDVHSASPAAPYTNWTSAATAIQDAVDAAAPGDQILVADGVYQSGGRAVYGSLTNRVVLDKAVAVQSLNGPAVTVIQGNPVIGDSAVRCAYLTNGASLSGFTLTQGGTRGDPGDEVLEQDGGGAWCESSAAALTNCVFAANQANNEGGGIRGGTLEGCILYSNAALYDAWIFIRGGGGAVGSVLNHCTLYNNSANSASSGGGASASVLNGCVLGGNSAAVYGGGVNASTLSNCLLTNNAAGYGGGGAWDGTLYNCTVVRNSAGWAGGADGATLYNCIVYYNSDSEGLANTYACELIHCCTTPDAGTSNFTNAPAFVDDAHGDYHLQAGSFCINAGANVSGSGSVDLEGNPRLVGAYVDVGAYEYQSLAPAPLSVSCTVAYTNVATTYTNALSAQIEGNATLYVWAFGDGTFATNQLNVSHVWAKAGTYFPTFTAWNSDHPAGVSAWFRIQVVSSATYYVALGSPNPAPPYSSWATAATDIQSAVDAAYVGGTVWVSNGVYAAGACLVPGNGGSNRLAVTKPLTVQSVNGPAVTLVKGYRGPGTTNDASSIRCALLSAGATLSGFTLTNGCTSSGGGGVNTVGSATISNCVIIGNAARCAGGGGASGNYYNCVVAGNSSGTIGGGLYYGTPYNSLIVSNWASASGGGAYGGNLFNCTVVGNYSAKQGGGTWSAAQRNCIVYYNTISAGLSGGPDAYSGYLDHCCTTLWSSGTGNFNAPPAFADAAAGDFHLLASSPCINAGANGFVTWALDLDGKPRIALGTVDLGPYEFQGLIRYVSPVAANPRAPYTTWATAATRIQDAVDAAAAGDFIVVSNGTYQGRGRTVSGSETNVVVLTNRVNVLSLNGPEATVLAGGLNTRCAYVGSNSLLSGFALSGGQTRNSAGSSQELNGGGAWCESGGVLSNCVVTGNRTLLSTGLGGGVCGGTLCNCTLTNNSAGSGGAAAAAVLLNCLVVSNSAPYSPSCGMGGGLYRCAATNCTLAGNGWGYGTTGGGAYQSTLANCLLITNLSTYGGGGADSSLLVNCTLSRNQGLSGGAGFCTNYCCVFSGNAGTQGGALSGGVAANCLIISNTAATYGGGACQGRLYNCTVVGNSATNYGGGVSGSTVYNSILHRNWAPYAPNYYGDSSLVSCYAYNSGYGDPWFVNLAAGNFRLQANSPCINAGNNAYVTNSADLDGNPRVMGGNVDLGAYEFPNPVSTINYAWLQQYSLPISAATDTADPDGDGMSNWEEWRAGTNPKDASSALILLPPLADASGVTVRWQGVNGKTYYVQRKTMTAAGGTFVTVQSNVTSFGGITTWTDFSAADAGPCYYRVGLQ